MTTVKSRFGVVVFLLAWILMLGIAEISLAQESQIVEEIQILGPTRSLIEIVTHQLPFAVGDEWDQNLAELTYLRLESLNIFDPSTLAVVGEEVGPGKLGIVINATDTSIFGLSPLEIVGSKVVGLIQSEITQTLRNPFRVGLNLEAGYKWKRDERWWKVGGQMAGYKGINFSHEFLNFEISEPANDLEYQIDGFSNTFGIHYIPATDWTLDTHLIYRENTLVVADDLPMEQKYLLTKVELIGDFYGELDLTYVYGHSLKAENKGFNQLGFGYVVDYELMEGDKVVVGLRGGVSSPETPLNDQFHAGGGFCQIPMRGHGEGLTATRFVTNTLEYQKQIIPDLYGIVFMDSGKFAVVDQKFQDAELLIDLGIGVAYDTPFGVLGRVDLGYGTQQKEWKWGLGVGHSY